MPVITTTTKTKEPSTKALALAHAAAAKFLATAYDHVHEVAGEEWCELSAEIERTRYADLKDDGEREKTADAEASFLIGLAIGGKLSGGAR